MNFDYLNAKKWREEHNFVVPEEYTRRQKANYETSMVLCVFLGAAINELFHFIFM